MDGIRRKHDKHTSVDTQRTARFCCGWPLHWRGLFNRPHRMPVRISDLSLLMVMQAMRLHDHITQKMSIIYVQIVSTTKDTQNDITFK